MLYNVKKAPEGFNYEKGWEDVGYRDANIVELTNCMGDRPAHFPKVEAKLLYDEKNIYVFFRVDDQYVRAIAQKLHDMVCRDSCVEFFFTPGENISDGYFNVEINCGGTLLIYHQTARGENKRDISEQDCEKIRISASLPKIIDPEIKGPTRWTLKYAIPIEILENYTKVERPAAGVKWHGNFYKCADATSHPHWLTWAKVDKPQPDFHRPEFFGTLIFD